MKELILSDAISNSVQATIFDTLKALSPNTKFCFLKIPHIICHTNDGYSYCDDSKTSDDIFNNDIEFENKLKHLLTTVNSVKLIVIQGTHSEFLVYRSLQIIESIDKNIPVSTLRVLNVTKLEIKKALKRNQPVFKRNAVLADKYKNIAFSTINTIINRLLKDRCNSKINISFLAWALLQEISHLDIERLSYSSDKRFVIKLLLNNGLWLRTSPIHKKKDAEEAYDQIKIAPIQIRKHDRILKAPPPLSIYDVLDKWNYKGKTFSEKYLSIIRLFYMGYITNPFIVGTGIPKKAVEFIRQADVWEDSELSDGYPFEYSKSGEPTAILPTSINREELPNNIGESDRHLYKFIRNHALATNAIDAKISEYCINCGPACINVNVVEKDSVNGCNYFLRYLKIFKGDISNIKGSVLRKSIEYTTINQTSPKDVFKTFDKYNMFSLKEIAIAYMQLINSGLLIERGSSVRASILAQTYIKLIEDAFPSINQNLMLSKIDSMFSRVYEVGKKPKKVLDSLCTIFVPEEYKFYGECPKDKGSMKLTTSNHSGYLECVTCKSRFMVMFDGSDVKIMRPFYAMSVYPYCGGHNKTHIKLSNYNKDVTVKCSECCREYIH